MSLLSLPLDFRRFVDDIDSGKSDLTALLTTTAKVLTVIALLAILVVGLQTTMGLRFVGGLFVFFFLLLAIWKIPQWGVILTLFYLVIVGGVRRWLIFDFGWLSFDPLVLVSPLISLMCFLQLLIARKVPTDTPLSNCVKYLLLIMALQVFNPLQGGLLVGFGGVLYYIAPLLWFYVGRIYGTTKVLLTLYKVAAFTFTLVAIYGLKQVFFGLVSSETEWLNTVGWGSMAVSVEALRVFSTLASQQEYAMVVSCAVVICMTFVIQRKFQYLLPLVVIFPALLYTGARGPIVFGLCAICVQWALQGKSRAVWLPRLGLALTLGVFGIIWGVSNIDTNSMDAGQGDLLRHQQEGLLNPGQSTAPQHLTLVGNGIVYSITHPLGAGLGSTTLAAGKLGGGAEGFGTETDIGNLFISLGFFGGMLNLVVVYFVVKEILAVWFQTRDFVFLILVGLLVATIGQWLNGALYSLCFLNWFAIGTMDRCYALSVEQALAKAKIETPPVVDIRGRRSRNSRVHTNARHNIQGRAFNTQPRRFALAKGAARRRFR